MPKLTLDFHLSPGSYQRIECAAILDGAKDSVMFIGTSIPEVFYYILSYYHKRIALQTYSPERKT